MTVTFQKGDIFSSTAEALVNPVNTFGVAGAGLALEFKRRFPVNFLAYKSACDFGYCVIGRVYSCIDREQGKWIINFPTKAHWKHPSTLGYIELGLQSLIREIQDEEIGSVAIPALGCGLGNLEWEAVKKLIVKAAAGIPDVDVQVYQPKALE